MWQKLFSEDFISTKELKKIFPLKPGSQGLRGGGSLMFRRRIWAVIEYNSIVNNFEGKVISTEDGEIYDGFNNEDGKQIIHILGGFGDKRDGSLGILTQKQPSESINKNYDRNNIRILYR